MAITNTTFPKRAYFILIFRLFSKKIDSRSRQLFVCSWIQHVTLPFTNSDETEESSLSLSNEDSDSTSEEHGEEEADDVKLEAEQDGFKRERNEDEED